jgi:SAM-dependent methyltransferase
MPITTVAVEDGEDEDARAKSYWSGTEEQAREHADQPPHVTALAELCLAAGARRILEFGCYGGRNLAAIRDAYAEAGEPEPELVGLDINEAALAWGRRTWNLDLRQGDETALAGFADGEWDLVLTVSVLDHMPEPTAALAELARIAGRRLVLVEPHPAERDGTGKAVRSFFGGDGHEPMPFTYLHDYDALLLGLPLVQELDLPMPTHLRRVGPLYRLRALAPRAHTGLMALLEASRGGVVGHGLPPAVARRIGADAPASAPRLHVAADAGGLAAALAAARPGEPVVAPRRALSLLPGGAPAAGAGLDGWLVVLGAPAAASAARGAETDGAALQDRLLWRILLRNREDAARMRTLEASARRAAAAPAPPAAPAVPSATEEPRAPLPSVGAALAKEIALRQREVMLGQMAALLDELDARPASPPPLPVGARIAQRIGLAQQRAMREQIVLLERAVPQDMTSPRWRERSRRLAERTLKSTRRRGRKLWKRIRKRTKRLVKSWLAPLRRQRRTTAPEHDGGEG